jgi:hypothetical protein
MSASGGVGGARKPLLLASAVGLTGLLILAGLWLTPLRASGESCGSLVGSLRTFTNHAVKGPCQHARSVRFAAGAVVAAIFALMAWVVFFASGGSGRFRR